MDPVVVFSILEPTVEATASRLAFAPASCGLIEIRADYLAASEIPRLVAEAPGPVLVTARPVHEGGGFDGGEDERRRVIQSALDAGAYLVDVEWGSPLAELVEGEHADRVVLSHHGAACNVAEIEPIYRAMAATRASRLKIVPRAERADELPAVKHLLDLAKSDDRALACFAMGEAGTASRILAPSWGSWATYGSVQRGHESAAGQITAHDLLETYRVLSIGPGTRLYALVGRPVLHSPSPAMHHAGYHEHAVDACYLPIDAADLENEIVPLAGPDGALGLEALAVTIPLKEQAAARSRAGDPLAARAGAVNTVVITADGWTGYNTDGPAARSLIGRHLEIAGARVAVAGAGGTARALAAVMADAGAEVTVYNRTRERARSLAEALGVRSAPWEDLAAASWDALIHATPLGRDGEVVLPPAALTGRVVLDVVYGSDPTPLIREARERGLETIDGFDLLVAQAVLQFERMTGLRPSERILREAGSRWLAGGSA